LEVHDDEAIHKGFELDERNGLQWEALSFLPDDMASIVRD